ncbi:MAG: DUF1540 domain-containing protein [Solirubrobacterales bacterium]
MKGDVNKTNEPISRVRCKVDSCHYYKDGDYCLAAQIMVEPPNSATSEDTDCATFVPKTS